MTAFYSKFRTFVLDWAWEELIPPSGSEPSGDRQSPLFVKDGNTFVLAGGVTNASVAKSDYWTFNYATRIWTQVFASGGPISGQFDYGALALSAGAITVFKSSGGVTQSIVTATGVATTLGTPASFPSTANYPFFAGTDGKVYHGYSDSVSIQRVNEHVHRLTLSGFASAVLTGAGDPDLWGRSTGAIYPANGKIYAFLAGNSGSSPTVWTLSANDIYTFDPAGPTGWTNETGVTNNAGSLALGGITGCPLLWVAAESKFFLLVEDPAYTNNGKGLVRVLTYDPAAKSIGEILFSGAPGGELFSGGVGLFSIQGGAGEGLTESGELFVLSHPKTGNARIWRLYKP